MTPAAAPRADPLEGRLLHVDPDTGVLEDRHITDLPACLRTGDLLIVNDAATLPASLKGLSSSGAPLEVRLAARGEREVWTGVVFGAEDWRTPTEFRGAAPPLTVGSRLSFGPDLGATVVGAAGPADRLLKLEFDQEGAAFWAALYRYGRPVQYSYLAQPFGIEAFQTAFASRPWAMESPSAGRPLTWPVLRELGARGVRIAALTHAAGLSSIGDAEADAVLPLPERYEIPTRTVEAVQETRGRGGRVIAVGTTVVRALEGSAARDGGLRPGGGVTDLRIGPETRIQVVDGLLTGMHEPDSSHFALLGAFASESVLLSAFRHAEAKGYLAHEFGDSTLLLPAA